MGLCKFLLCLRHEKQGETFVFFSGAWVSLLVCLFVCFSRFDKKDKQKTKGGGGEQKPMLLVELLALKGRPFPRFVEGISEKNTPQHDVV